MRGNGSTLGREHDMRRDEDERRERDRERERDLRDARRRMTPYERTRAMVYATGNRWQIENFEATH